MRLLTVQEMNEIVGAGLSVDNVGRISVNTATVLLKQSVTFDSFLYEQNQDRF